MSTAGNLCVRLLVLAAISAILTSSSVAAEKTVAALAKETHFHGIAVDAADPSRLFLATHHGLYVTRADGKAQLISEVRDYMGFTAHPTDAQTLFASGHPAGGGNLGFIISRDGGRTWTKLSDGVDGPVDFHQMDVSKADPKVVYGVYDSLQRSDDGGSTWRRVGPAPDGIIVLAASSLDTDTIYAGTQNGLMKSTDGGRSWQQAYERTTTMVHVTRDGTIYAYFVGLGLARASEKNPAWQLVGGSLGGEVMLHFAADPLDPQRLYAVSYHPRTRMSRVIASRDGGRDWSQLGAK
jgi:photosystem II stability/assembly factor-like uncharacterized protein